MPIPDHVITEAHFHITSDAFAVSCAIKICCREDFSSAKWDELTQKACAILNKALGSSDARPMTKEEVLVYRVSDEEEQENAS